MESMIKTGECVNCGKEIQDKHPKATVNDHPICLECVKLINESAEWGTFIDELDRLFRKEEDTEERADYESEGFDEEEDFEQWEEEDAQDED